MTIMQGCSCSVPFYLKQQGKVLTPDLISEIEVCVGETLRRLYSAGEVWYDVDSEQWYIRVTQQETLNMTPGVHPVIARVKYLDEDDSDVAGACVGNIVIPHAPGKGVL